MSGSEFVVRPRLDEVKRLLDDADLPSSDIDESMLANFFSGRLNGSLIGIAGLEPCGRAGLLRSLVVVDHARGTGVGRALAGEVERHAGELGIETLYLLTTTAESYFRRLGYDPCGRDAAPPLVRRSREFSALCPADAAFMCKHIGSAR